MGKKRKGSQKVEGPSGSRDVDPADARLGPISDYRDVADSEDEYFMRQNEITLEDGPAGKRRKQAEMEDAFLEVSDEEILAYSDGSDDLRKLKRTKVKGGKSTQVDSSDDDSANAQGQDEGEGDLGWWGSSKNDYYEADPIATEADALAEEKEARRIQQKRLAKMTDADFLDETEWLAAGDAEDEDEEEAALEVLQDVGIPDDISPEEQYAILQTRYPEFSLLVDELQQLQQLLPEVAKEAGSRLEDSVAVAKHYVLGSLLAALASYIALLTSPARDSAGNGKLLSPAELRDHEIMQVLLQCKEAWLRVNNLKAPATAETVSGLPSPPEENVPVQGGLLSKITRLRAEEQQPIQKKVKKDKRLVGSKHKLKEIEDSLAGLDDLLVKQRSILKSRPSQASDYHGALSDNRSDFGEEETLNARAGAEKAARKKSLRFYTSQIVQKSNKRTEGAKNAGGDDDIPYRERLKDRQIRLQAEAERRGKRDSKFGADLDSNDASDNEDATGKALRSQEDEYYDMIAQTSAKRRDEKARKFAAFAEAGKADRVVELEGVGEDGKRKISYAIQKNKGMTPRRKKEVKNPRVKKKEQFKKKQTKIKSMKPTYKGGEAPGGYGGELSGIKAGLVKSVKL
jgi:U3 small nucleolar RNA-associated protein 3